LLTVKIATIKFHLNLKIGVKLLKAEQEYATPVFYTNYYSTRSKIFIRNCEGIYEKKRGFVDLGSRPVSGQTSLGYKLKNVCSFVKNLN
jgi:hypothetical protein